MKITLKQIIARMKNSANAICIRCKKIVLSVEDGVCMECLDDQLELETGCRFGTPETCDHPDCGGLN